MTFRDYTPNSYGGRAFDTAYDRGARSDFRDQDRRSTGPHRDYQAATRYDSRDQNYDYGQPVPVPPPPRRPVAIAIQIQL